MVNAAASRRETSARAGRYVAQPTGYRAFVPASLPPRPAVRLSSLQRLLSDADRALGRLDGSIQTLPNPDLLVYMYVRKEAVLSSQIEGTQSSCRICWRWKPSSGPRGTRAMWARWSPTCAR